MKLLHCEVNSRKTPTMIMWVVCPNSPYPQKMQDIMKLIYDSEDDEDDEDEDVEYVERR